MSDTTVIRWYVLDEVGNPVPSFDVMTSMAWMEDHQEERYLHQETITDSDGQEFFVSTVFLGLDHNHSGKGPPVLWETMVFGPYDGEWQARYTSRTAALEGHKKAVQWVLDGMKDEDDNAVCPTCSNEMYDGRCGVCHSEESNVEN